MNRRFSEHAWFASSYATGVFEFDMPPDGEYLIVAVDHYIPYASGATGAGAGADARLAAELAKIAPLADRIQAKQGTTIKTTLTVRR
jgi:hypothetical protein